MWSIWLACIMAGLWLTAAWRQAASRGRLLPRLLLQGDQRAIKDCFGAPAIVRALDDVGLLKQAESHLSGLHASLLLLKGDQWSMVHTRLHLAGGVVQGYGAALSGMLVAAAAGEDAIAWLGFACGLLIPASRIRSIREAVKKSRQGLLLALPDLLIKLMLLVGAGETMQKALFKCADREEMREQDLLYAELGRAVKDMDNGASFAAAIEVFSRRCAVQEISVFTTVLLLNYRRGGQQLALSLLEISHPLWEKRKSMARSRGEEASSKLVFPLTGIFFLLMVLIGAPAMLLMN